MPGAEGWETVAATISPPVNEAAGQPAGSGLPHQTNSKEHPMKCFPTFAAVPVLALSLVLVAGPTLAQQAAEQPAAQARSRQTGAGAAENGQRTITGRALMSAEERSSFRRQMEQATPEQRQQLWETKHAELAQRASQRGLVLAEPGSGRNGALGERGEGRHQGPEGGRGEGGSMMSRMMGWAPRAP